MKITIDRRHFLQRLGFLSAGLMAGCKTVSKGWTSVWPKDRLLEKYRLDFALQGHP
jgi:hypothetical protein